MVYENIDSAKEVFRRYSPINNYLDINCISYTSKSHNIKIGDFLLFQHVTKDKISRPILAVFVGFSFWDMAQVMSFVEVPRAYYYSEKYEISVNKNIDYSERIGHMDPQIETIQFWTDNIHLLGHYKSKPTLSQLRNTLTP